VSTRRALLRALGLGTVGLAVAPARPAWAALSEGALADEALGLPPLGAVDLVRLDKNENPVGPFASARQAVLDQWSEANRYPDGAERALVAAIAAYHGVTPEHVVLGAGSGEILQVVTRLFTSPARPLVQAHPTFEAPGRTAESLGHRVVSIPVTAALALDLDHMIDAARGAGLVFLCNPNNPTGTVHGAEAVRGAIARIRERSPGTTILVDEAYHDYVDDPAYASMVPLAARDPWVVVSRTFSKAHGLAGLRVGYAIAAPETAVALRAARLGNGVNQLAAAAAHAALADTAALRAEQARNRAVRDDLRAFFTGLGYAVGQAEVNFLMVDLKRPAADVRAACRAKGVAVGRPFPPLTTHLRISLGTQPQVDRAKDVLRAVLSNS
jgi:histidinol-phosphate aminotransferase